MFLNALIRSNCVLLLASRQISSGKLKSCFQVMLFYANCSCRVRCQHCNASSSPELSCLLLPLQHTILELQALPGCRVLARGELLHDALWVEQLPRMVAYCLQRQSVAIHSVYVDNCSFAPSCTRNQPIRKAMCLSTINTATSSWPFKVRTSLPVPSGDPPLRTEVPRTDLFL